MENNLNPNILINIFYNINNEPKKLLPIIKNQEKIKDLISFFKSRENSINKKFELISNLFILFKSNISLIPLFIKSFKRNNLNLLYESIFDIYLHQDIKQDKEETLEKLINLLIVNTSLPKSAPEYLYQKMSKFYENDDELDEILFMKYLKLLHICYKDNSLNLESVENLAKNKKGELLENDNFGEIKKDKEVKNYMYFSGINSSLTLKINNNSINGYTEFPSLENGCSFVFWLNLDKKILFNYSTINNLKENSLNINLILMNFDEHQIKFILKENKYFQLIIDNIESSLIDMNSIFTFGGWVNICFVITEAKAKNQPTIKIYINGASIQSTLTIPQNFPLNKKIKDIILFQNLIGRVSSLLFFSFPLSQKLINTFSLHMKNGIYKNKILFKFLLFNEKNYFNNSMNYKYYEKYKNQKNKEEKLINILLKEYSLKNIIAMFCPFAYNNRENQIDDIFGNYIGIFSKNDGVNYYINPIKNIETIGGISNLLPIAELMLKFKNSKNKKNLLNEESLLKYFNIIKDIIIGHNNNLYEANKNYFFSNLALFLERFPSQIYTENLLSILLDIGKEVFQFNDIKNTNINDNYINNILLNEKIFSKFSTENQVKLWEEVNKFFISDYSIMKESLNIYKICILLRFYDEKRYNEYCCKWHSDIIKSQGKFENSNNKTIKKIMNPEMNRKTEKLFETIQLYMNNFGTEENTVNLYKLLSLDLSPCLQIKIIQVYINYFNSKNISDNLKKKNLNNLLKNKYFEITEYALTLSLLEVRIQILKLLKLILQNYRNFINSFFGEYLKKKFFIILNFIGSNLFPDKLMVEIEYDKKFKDDKDLISYKKTLPLNVSIRKRTMSPINFKKNERKIGNSFYEKKVIYKDTIPLIKYINKDIYNEELKTLWKMLEDWLIYDSKEKKEKSLKVIEINNYIINFCLNFVIKNNINYIDDFMISIYAYFTDEFITNSKVLYTNQKLLSWIIETIFYYHNKENNKFINNKIDEKHFNSIKTRSLEVLNFFLKDQNRQKEEFQHLVQFIFFYSIYIKNKVDEENILELEKKNKKNEITRITSMLLLKCIEFSGKYINFTTKVCFRFLICYKNIKLIKNKIRNNDDSFEVIDSPLNNNNQFEFSILKNNNFNINNKYENISKKFNNDKDSLIPYNVLDGLNYFSSKIQNIDKESANSIRASYTIINISNVFNNNENTNALLKEIWKDFSLYDYIIDYYYSNIWGLENLCKKVNIEYDNKPLELIKKLYKEYSSRKKYKNILFETILECLNIKLNEDNNENNNKNLNSPKGKNIINFNKKDDSKNKYSTNNENILKFNLILLSIAIEITKDKAQKEYLENQYQQLIIFCIIASINIKSSEKKYDLIQKELYNIIGYGCLFLKSKNELKYQQIYKYLINPIFKEINDSSKNKSFKKMFNFTKKTLYDKTAVFKLFGTKGNQKTEENEESLKMNKTFKKSTSSILRYSSCFDLSNLNNDNEFNLGNENGNDNENINEDFINNTRNINDDFVDINMENNKIKPELNVDKDKVMENIFNIIVYQYEKINKKIDKSIKIILDIINNDKEVEKEKKRVFVEIKKLLPNYIETLKKYSNTSYLKEKQRRNNYKKCKIKLFSWRGFWSNKYLFFTHPEYLKLKIKNHYTKEMIKPILSPVLDINYYLPKFKLFDKKNLFNKNNYYYNINLDIDDILKDETKLNNSNNKESFNSIKNSYGFNYLECIYKMQDEEIWEQYKLSYEQKLNFNKMYYKRKETVSNSITKNGDKNIDKNGIHEFKCCIVKVTNHIKGYVYTKKNYFEFIYDANEEDFNYNIENLNLQKSLFSNFEEDISYDNDMGCCYGSLFKKHKRDKEKINFIIKYENIQYIFIRNYYYRDTALEIFTYQNKHYILNFKTNDDLLLFITDITKNNDSNIKFRQIASNIHDEKDNKKILGYEKLLSTMKNKIYYISDKTEKWQNYNISTLEYLMWMNIYSGRSFDDLNQYPVFPWIITNYSNDKISQNDIRSLNLPMGMLEVSDKSINRKSLYIDFYESIKNDFIENYPDIDYQSFLNKGHEYLNNYKKKKIKLMKKEKNQIDDVQNNFDIPYNQIPYNYGTHYSNPTYVSHFLSRVFPYSFVSIEIHGNKFDDPERMFFSLEKTFESVTTLKDDIREIIPEFYYLPEMFKNINNLNLAQDKFDSNGNEIIINNVDLPPWSSNDAVNLILEKRKYLESEEIHINKWIDIIFGSYQRGENAEKINNIYMSYTYEKMIKIMEIADYDQRCALLRLYEMGATPRILFKNDIQSRPEKTIFFKKNKSKFLEDSKNLDKTDLKMTKYNELNNYAIDNKDLKIKISPKIVKINIINNENLKIFTNLNKFYNLNLKKEKKEKKEKKDKNEEKQINSDEKQNIYNFENASSLYAATYQINSIETPIIIYNNNKLILKGGFWDGRIEINSISSDSKKDQISSIIFTDYDIPIVFMEMSKDEKLLLCGTKNGSIIAYEVNAKIFKIKDIFYSHSDEITSISINDTLNMFATTSVDGYIMIHILPSMQLVRAIHISSFKQKNLNNKQKNLGNIINENEEINTNIIIENEVKKSEKNEINKGDEIFLGEYNEEKCLYADNVFLSSSPLPCIVIFISSKRIFRAYTINGEVINELEETQDSSRIYSSIIYNNLNFHEFLIYGTDNGYVKIRSFPKMELINSIKIRENNKIITLTLSNDKRNCYAWGNGDLLAIINDNIISDFQEIE